MTQLPSWSDGLYFLFGLFSCPNLLLVFLNLIFLGTCYIFFFISVWTFSVFCSFFALKSNKKEKVLDRGQNVLM